MADKKLIDEVPIYEAEVICSICFERVVGLLYEGPNYYGSYSIPTIFRRDGKLVCKACWFWLEAKTNFDREEGFLRKRMLIGNRSQAGVIFKKAPYNGVAKAIEASRAASMQPEKKQQRAICDL